MRHWTKLLGLALLLVLGIAAPAHAEDALEDFVVLGEDPVDFQPVGRLSFAGALFFVGGQTRATDLEGDAAPVALDERDGREVWRAVEGLPDGSEAFTTVGSAGGRVCAAGTVGINPTLPFPLQREIVVACYGAQRGERLWFRRIPLDPRRPFVGVRLDVSERAVVVLVNTLSLFALDNLVLRFDAKDGSGG